jgi:hypothetical protein
VSNYLKVFSLNTYDPRVNSQNSGLLSLFDEFAVQPRHVWIENKRRVRTMNEDELDGFVYDDNYFTNDNDDFFEEEKLGDLDTMLPWLR